MQDKVFEVSQNQQIDAEAHRLAQTLQDVDSSTLKGVAMELKQDLQSLHTNDARMRLINETNEQLGGKSVAANPYIDVQPGSGNAPSNVFIVKGEEKIAAGTLPSQ